VFDIEGRIMNNIFYLWRKLPVPDIRAIPLPMFWQLLYLLHQEEKEKLKAYKKAQRK